MPLQQPELSTRLPSLPIMAPDTDKDFQRNGFLGREMMEKAAVGNARMFADFCNRGFIQAIGKKQLARRCKDAVAGFGLGGSHSASPYQPGMKSKQGKYGLTL
jgi:hypothetical protein